MPRRALVLAVLAALAAAAPAPAQAPPAQLPFYPQAGVIGQDLYIANYLDLADGPGVRDWACGAHSYDTHTGQDSIIRSFREQAIGVPVFAARDGTVLEVQTGFFDRNWGPTTERFDNHVVIRHADGDFTIYGHLRLGSIRVRNGDLVVAGQQLGLTASSGNSSWPHLHFTWVVDGAPFEPFAGPCRAGASGWGEQPEIRPDAWVNDVALSARPFTGKAALPFDEAVRTGTFVRGTRNVYVRIELRNLEAAGPGRLTVTRPDGSAAYAAGFTVTGQRGLGTRAGWATRRLRLALATGRWLVRYELGDRVVAEAPFDVVARARQVVNRPPNAVTVTLKPGDVPLCVVGTSLVNEDPDYDIVRYRYRWSAGGRLLRQVTSAALSDAVRRGAARPGETVQCEVTPSDGRLRGPMAAATAVVSG
jgi:peptidase M23-like protein